MKTKLEPTWVTIRDKSMLLMLLQCYASDDKSKILEVASRPKTIPDIVKGSRLPKTSTYRNVHSLIQDYLLFPVGHILLGNGKLVTKYISLFERVEFHTIKNEILARARVSKDAPPILLKMVVESPGNTLEEKIVRKIKHSQNEKEMIRRLITHIEKRNSKI